MVHCIYILDVVGYLTKYCYLCREWELLMEEEENIRKDVASKANALAAAKAAVSAKKRK